MTRRTQQEILESSGSISAFVRSKRHELNYTQETLAKRCGVGLRFLKELELDKKTLKMDKVNQVLIYFGFELIPSPIQREPLDE